VATHRTYIEHLRNLSMFQGFSRRDLERIAAVSEVVDIPAGTTLVAEGSIGNDAYVVLAGTVVIQRNGRKVREMPIGAVFGELALLDKGVRTATAVCTTECTLLMLSRPGFLGVVEQVPDLTHKLLASLATRVRELDKVAYG
jgi:CRP/FNR family transcriptional regulator, cyclic AMP receptor protein